MAIAFYAEDIELPAINKQAVSGWVRAVAATYGKKTGDISYIFCSDEKILEVNRQYLQHDYYTDIITFDYTEGTRFPAIYSSVWIRSRRMPRLFILRITKNCIGLLFTGFCIFAASTIKVRANGKSWRRMRIKPWRFYRKHVKRPDQAIKGNKCLLPDRNFPFCRDFLSFSSM